MSAHTPGPWRIASNGAVTVSGPDGFSICNSGNTRHRDYPETRANLRLIAAAPTLLDTLRRIESAFNRFEHPEEVRGYIKEIAAIAIAEATS